MLYHISQAKEEHFEYWVHCKGHVHYKGHVHCKVHVQYKGHVLPWIVTNTNAANFRVIESLLPSSINFHAIFALDDLAV